MPKTLLALFDAAVAAAMPSRCLPAFIPKPAEGRTLVVAAGKAAAAMAQIFERDFAGAVSGVAVVPDGHEARCERIEVVSAAHPVPDSRNVAASRRVIEQVQGLSRTDQLVCLLSGGASACLCLPADELTLANKQDLSRKLLGAGASISEINCVRKHLSAIKGGRLAAAAWPAACRTYAISDVPGDDPAVIGSGPTCADETRSADALAVLEKYGAAQESAMRWLARAESETLKPGDGRLEHSEYQIVATAGDALAAAGAKAGEIGLDSLCLGDDLEGEASVLAAEHAERVREILASTPRPAKPLVLLSGGETTVRVAGSDKGYGKGYGKSAGKGLGKGGRNTEYLLALAAALDGQRGVSALACDSDGIDGCGGHAGALYTPDMSERWAQRGLEPQVYAASSDTAGFFAALDALLTTGPTLTNVNDFRAILLLPEAW